MDGRTKRKGELRMPGRVEAICLSAAKGEKKSQVEKAVFVENHGIEGDAHAGDWHRQVSLLDAGDIEYMKGKGLPNLQYGDFAENLVCSGIDVSSLGLGSSLKIGSDAEIVFTQLGKVCHSRCAIYHQTGDCIMPRLGVFARITRGGEVNVGDAIDVSRAVPREIFQCVVLTISDRCSRGEAEDTAGPGIAKLLLDELPSHIYAQEVLADDGDAIKDRLNHYSAGHSIDLICAVGGTGFAPRDVTPEAVTAVIERATPGLDEAMRAASLNKTPHAMLSRAKSGIKGSTLIVSLPGSEKASRENMQVILPALEHGLLKLRGDKSDCGRPQEGSTA
jgi:molybdenum cofactor synthesis domain-containing protein